MQITGGEVQGLEIQTFDDPEDRADDLDPISQAFLDAFKQYQRGNVKAAASHGVDAINMIAEKHSINCGADL